MRFILALSIALTLAPTRGSPVPKRFQDLPHDAPQLFGNENEVSYADVSGDGNCTLVSALQIVAYRRPELVRRLVQVDGDGARIDIPLDPGTCSPALSERLCWEDIRMQPVGQSACSPILRDGPWWPLALARVLEEKRVTDGGINRILEAITGERVDLETLSVDGLHDFFQRAGDNPALVMTAPETALGGSPSQDFLGPLRALGVWDYDVAASSVTLLSPTTDGEIATKTFHVFDLGGRIGYGAIATDKAGKRGVSSCTPTVTATSSVGPASAASSASEASSPGDSALPSGSASTPTSSRSVVVVTVTASIPSDNSQPAGTATSNSDTAPESPQHTASEPTTDSSATTPTDIASATESVEPSALTRTDSVEPSAPTGTDNLSTNTDGPAQSATPTAASEGTHSFESSTAASSTEPSPAATQASPSTTDASGTNSSDEDTPAPTPSDDSSTQTNPTSSPSSAAASATSSSASSPSSTSESSASSSEPSSTSAPSSESSESSESSSPSSSSSGSTSTSSSSSSTSPASSSSTGSSSNSSPTPTGSPTPAGTMTPMSATSSTPTHTPTSTSQGVMIIDYAPAPSTKSLSDPALCNPFIPFGAIVCVADAAGKKQALPSATA